MQCGKRSKIEANKEMKKKKRDLPSRMWAGIGFESRERLSEVRAECSPYQCGDQNSFTSSFLPFFANASFGGGAVFEATL